MVINWGASEVPRQVAVSKIINNPTAVSEAGNKLTFFKKAEQHKVRTVPWTESQMIAREWLEDGHTVVARKSLTGHSGRGILLVKEKEELPECSLYTQYVPKDSEFRVHIMSGEVIDIQRKIRDPDREPSDWKIRSHSNGFMFVREGFEIPADAKSQSLLAIHSSGLDFGAVDVIYNQKRKKAYILEINCAPGLEGQTVGVYADAFKKLLSDRTKAA